jgi:hypothetical protein
MPWISTGIKRWIWLKKWSKKQKRSKSKKLMSRCQLLKIFTIKNQCLGTKGEIHFLVYSIQKVLIKYHKTLFLRIFLKKTQNCKFLMFKGTDWTQRALLTPRSSNTISYWHEKNTKNLSTIKTIKKRWTSSKNKWKMTKMPKSRKWSKIKYSWRCKLLKIKKCKKQWG